MGISVMGGNGLLDGVGGGNWRAHMGDNWVNYAISWTFCYGVGEGSADTVRLDNGRVMSWCSEDGGRTGGSQQCGENDGNHDDDLFFQAELHKLRNQG